MFETVRTRPINAILPGDVPLTLPLLARSHLIPPIPEADFMAALLTHLGEGPWARSFAMAPVETAHAVAYALRDLMMATPTLRPAAIDARPLDPASRAFRHLSALRDLWIKLGDLLPPDLAILRAVLELDAGDSIDPLHVIHDPDDPALSPVEHAVIAALIARHGLPDDIAPRRASLIADRDACAGEPGMALHHLQADMLSPTVRPIARDHSVRVFGLRDVEAEAYVAASLAQHLLDGTPGLSPSDIGLVLPAGPAYVPFVREAFGRAGLPLSGLPANLETRDLVGECLLHVLLCLRPQTPAMARASLLRLALMPWPAETGRRLSQAAMDGARDLNRIVSLDRRSRAFLELLEGRPARAPALADLLERLPACLSTEPAVAEDLATLAYHAGALAAALRLQPADGEIAWDDLIARIPVAAAKPDPAGPRLLDAITVLVDGESPEHPVDHLMVLGFTEGSFPVSPGINPVFLDSEIEMIRDTCGLDLKGRATILARRLDIFRRQIRSAHKSLTVFVPWRDSAGAALAPSASLCLMARCFTGCEEPEHLIEDLTDESAEDAIPRAPETKGLPLQPLAVPEEISLGGNLLALRVDGEGRMRAQSPSRLDKLLVSPLAWLLNELGIAASIWAPESLDVLTVGSLFHRLAEELFPAGAPLPSERDIETRLPDLMKAAVEELAPFLLAATWMVERGRLQAEFTVALISWRRTLASLGAEILANELPLSGEALGIPCRGTIDSLLRLPDGELVIVDHKTSGAGVRRQRMEQGWDLQVEIYRLLASQAKGNPEFETKGLVPGPDIAVAYHTTRDGTLLFHGAAPTRTAPGLEVIDADIGAAALARLRAELSALEDGRLELPAWTTLDRMARGGVKPYALDDSPLVAAFVRAPDAEGGSDDD